MKKKVVSQLCLAFKEIWVYLFTVLGVLVLVTLII